MTEKRAQFATRLGVIATTVGSAVGLGNIWRFPYEAGVHGGGAFLLIDLLFIFVIGVPVICAEFIIGRHTGSNVRGAFKRLAPGKPWGVVGYIGILASLLILSFYSVVAGWTLEYIYQSITDFSGVHTAEGLHDQFDRFAQSNWRPVMWTVVFLLCNYCILSRGVRKGIEKMSNILMPLLFLILLIFAVNSLMMPEASRGLEFLFKPDFSKVTPSVLLGGMGQAFFSLSLGLGCLITYSSYFKKDTPLVRTAFTTAGLDTLVSILAGVIIFPAVFTFGQEPAAGPKLVFEILPSIFSNLEGGVIWSTFFFVLLFLASLTSTISMSEISIAYFVEEFGMRRRKATALNFAIALVFGSLCALSFGCMSDFTICGMTLFNLFDYLSSNILLPVGGMIISVFVGWVLDRAVLKEELGSPAGPLMRFVVRAIVFCLRYVAPICIGMVFVFGLGIF
ncbi:MAG: sodium-dependent transporter [Duncaniella sp.]|nr:sodium-dependent transporter [Duncaniella sp.]